MSHVTSFFKSYDKVVELVGEGCDIKGPIPSRLYILYTICIIEATGDNMNILQEEFWKGNTGKFR